MKKIILTFLTYLISMSFLMSQKTYIPDDNFEQALIDLGYDSIPLDDSVSTNNINNLSFLLLNGKGISDLTGIEDFRNLERLICIGNNLTHLDVSKNKKLKFLTCQSNNLTHLDVSKNTALIELRCFNNNLSTLDLSKNTALEKLVCTNNNLSVLNLKNNNNIKLDYLQIGSNPNLHCIQVDDTTFSKSNWSGINYVIDSQSQFGLYCSSLVSLEEELNENISVFPNPTSGMFQVISNNQGRYSLSSIDGKQIISSGKLQSNLTQIDVSNRKAGMYLLHVITDEGNMIIKRIVKQ